MIEMQFTDKQPACVRSRTLSWLAGMSVAAGEVRAAEGYLLELLAWCAFGDKAEDTNTSA